MRVRFTAVLAALALLLGASSARAQSQTGEIFGKVTDESGAVLPGVAVTLTGPILLQPLTATTSETGTFQFPRLDVGTYTVKFELAGFKTVVNEGIQVTVGFSAKVNAQLGVSTVQETVTVTGESPIVDTKADRHQADVHASSCCRAFRRRATRGSSSSRRPASRWTARTSAATCRASSPTTCRAAATRPTTSGRSTASTSPTCRRPARRPATTTSTRSRR